MPSRLLSVALALYLSVVLFACSKARDNSSQASPEGSPAAQEQETAASSTPASPARKGTTQPAKAQAPQPVVIPSGTVLTVRLGEAVGSKISSAGQSFSATLADPVEVGGQTVIPAGASASGTVVDAKPLGRFKGGASLQLKLTSVTVNGTERAIETSSVVRSAKGKGKRTATMIGGGAGVGALIGGLVGGGKGAAIGAATGAGAGTAGTAFTGNKDIVLPAESALSFKLEQALELK